MGWLRVKGGGELLVRKWDRIEFGVGLHELKKYPIGTVSDRVFRVFVLVSRSFWHVVP